MAMQKKLNLFIALGLSVVAVILINVYLMKQQQTTENRLKELFLEKSKSLVPVVKASKDIRANTEITSDMVYTDVVSKNDLQPQVATSTDKVIDKRALIDIRTGQQITLNALQQNIPRQAVSRQHTLADRVDFGKRAITISVDQITGVGGMLKPGDYVDVIASIAIPVQTAGGEQVTQLANIPLFQNVHILAVGQTVVEARPKADPAKPAWQFRAPEPKRAHATQQGPPLITLALTPHEANLLSFVSQQGRIQLLLRNAADGKKMTLAPANWESFFQYVNSLMPQQNKRQQKAEEEKKVEIYRGLKRDYIPLLSK